MPEVKRFFYDSVLKGEYGDKLTVKFIPGATPELVLFGADGEELSREVVQSMSYAELHTFVQSKGFKRVKVLQQEQEDEDEYDDSDPNVAAGLEYDEDDGEDGDHQEL